MSWEIFKQNMLRTLNNPDSLKDLDTVADKWTKEYDAAVKRGFDTINQVTLKQGNTEIMKQLIKLALLKGQSSTTPYDLVGEMGKGVQAYWGGAIMNEFPIPLIPAPGSIQNVSVVSNTVTTPGTWTPAVGVPGVNSGDLESAKQKINEASFQLNPIDAEELQLDLGLAYGGLDTELSGFDYNNFEGGLTLEQSGELGTLDYIFKTELELETGELSSATVNLTEEESEAVTNATDEKLKTTLGERMVEIARADIGILETKATLKDDSGKEMYGEANTGGKKSENGNGRFDSIDDVGRIDEMHLNSKLQNRAWRIDKGLQGYFWCASAVTTWWKEAGAIIPTFKPEKGGAGPASCPRWVQWAKEEGYWYPKTQNYVPPIGAAVLYYKNSYYHIGMVSAVLDDGQIMTIEGNTNGMPGERNGGGVYEKKVNTAMIGGYVVIPELENSTE